MALKEAVFLIAFLLQLSPFSSSFGLYDPNVYYEPYFDPTFVDENQYPVDDIYDDFGLYADRVEGEPGPQKVQIKPNEDWKLIQTKVVRPDIEGSGWGEDNVDVNDKHTPPKHIRLIQPILLQKIASSLYNSRYRNHRIPHGHGPLSHALVTNEHSLQAKDLLNNGKVVILNFCPEAVQNMTNLNQDQDQGQSQNQISWIQMIFNQTGFAGLTTTTKPTPGTLMMYHAVKVVSHTTPSTSPGPTRSSIHRSGQYPLMFKGGAGYENPDEHPFNNVLERLVIG